MEEKCEDTSSLNRRTSKRLSGIREKREEKRSNLKSKTRLGLSASKRSNDVIILDDEEDTDSKPEENETIPFKEYSPEPELVNVHLGLFNQSGSIIATKLDCDKPTYIDTPPRKKRPFNGIEDLYESGSSGDEKEKTIKSTNVNKQNTINDPSSSSTPIKKNIFENAEDVIQDPIVKTIINNSIEIKLDPSAIDDSDTCSTNIGLLETLQSKTFNAKGEIIEPYEDDHDESMIGPPDLGNDENDIEEPLSPGIVKSKAEAKQENEISSEKHLIIEEETSLLKSEDDDAVEEKETEFELPRTIKCTSCGRSHKSHQFCQHPVLKVVVCKSCTKFYNSGNFTRDEFGIEEFCKWCADGGALICCDHCEKSFCEACVKRNLGKTFLEALKKSGDDEVWKCFSCDQSQIEDLQEFCKNVVKILHQEKTHGVVFQKKEIHLEGPNQERRLTRLNKASDVIENNDEANMSTLGEVLNDLDSEGSKNGDDNDTLPSILDVDTTVDNIDVSNDLSKKKIIKPNKLNVIISRIKNKNICQYHSGDDGKSSRMLKREKYDTTGSEIVIKTETSEDGLAESRLIENDRQSDLMVEDSANVINHQDNSLPNSSTEDLNHESNPTSPVITNQSLDGSEVHDDESSEDNKVSMSEDDDELITNLSKKKYAKGGNNKNRHNTSKVLSESEKSSESSSSDDSVNNKTTRLRTSRRRRRAFCDSDSSSSDNDAPLIDFKKSKRKASPQKKKKSRKVKTVSSGDSSADEKDTPSKKSKRKNIRRILKDEELTEETKKARKLEEDRRQRLLEKTKAVFNESLEKVNSIDTESAFYLENNDNYQVKVHPVIAKELKPHQREGIQFLYDSCIESVKKWKDKDEGSGALLSHCMGLGKTLQTVALIHTLITHDQINLKTVLVVAPLNTVYNWQAEFEKWLPVEDRLDVMVLTDARSSMWSRTDMISDWYELGGILIIGYHMYRNLSSLLRIKGKRQKKIITESLVDPGPDLVICDEGHVLKNNKSALSIAMNKIKTKRRIVLTGTPLQNNLMEYHVMVDFIKPNLLGTRTEFQNRFVNPIHNGQCADSTIGDVRIMKQRCHVLNRLLSGFVQRKDYSVLKPFLTPKHEYTVFIRLSTKQIKLYETYLEKFVYHELYSSGNSLFSNYQTLMRIWSHPWGLKVAHQRRLERQRYDSLDEFLDDSDSDDNSSSKDEESDQSEVDVTPSKKRRKTAPIKSSSDKSDQSVSNASDDDDVVILSSSSESETEVIKSKSTKPSISKLSTSKPSKSNTTSSNDDLSARKTRTTRAGTIFNEEDEVPEADIVKEWFDDLIADEDENDILLSGKVVFLLEILADAELVGDKVLIFSQSLVSLELIEKALGGGTVGGDRINWVKGCDYFRMDGSTNAQIRQRWIDTFNDPDNTTARLFLISTRAGSLGANMVAANRVIIFDCSWNPSHDVQSIFRVYRFGQLKPCYIYRLIAEGTMEQKIYERQITKLAMAGRVVDKQQIQRHFTNEEIKELYTFTSKPFSEDTPNETPQLPKDPILAEVLQRNHPKWIVKYHEHDLLLEDKAEEQLTEEERTAAWANYEAEKERMLNPPIFTPFNHDGIPRTGEVPPRNTMQQSYTDHVQNLIELQRQRWVNQRISDISSRENVLSSTPINHIRLQSASIPSRAPIEEIIATPAGISTDEMYRMLQMQNIARSGARTTGIHANQYRFPMHVPRQSHVPNQGQRGPSQGPSVPSHGPSMHNQGHNNFRPRNHDHLITHGRAPSTFNAQSIPRLPTQRYQAP